LLIFIEILHRRNVISFYRQCLSAEMTLDLFYHVLDCSDNFRRTREVERNNSDTAKKNVSRLVI